MLEENGNHRRNTEQREASQDLILELTLAAEKLIERGGIKKIGTWIQLIQSVVQEGGNENWSSDPD